MFSLVNDIEAYPEYMPGCTGARVLKRGENWLEAQVQVGMMGLSQRFTTRNTLVESESMTLALVEGPFSEFKGEWQFQALASDACKVIFWLEFRFSSLFAKPMEKMMEQVASKQVDALCKRAKSIYGATQ
jgi:ribosome-associated toxin RatA of RatAB toxin-antitoxin module